MSGSEEKKLNSLHEEDSLYKAQGGKAAYQISPTYGQNTLYMVNPVQLVSGTGQNILADAFCRQRTIPGVMYRIYLVQSILPICRTYLVCSFSPLHFPSKRRSFEL